MKLTCDLCGGTLQMNAGAEDASCKTCGLCYSLKILREKLGLSTEPPKKAAPASPVSVVPTPPISTPPQISAKQPKPVPPVVQ